MGLYDISFEIHRTLWVYDITPPFDIYKKLNLLWRAASYLNAAVRDMRMKLKDEHPDAEKLDEAIKELDKVIAFIEGNFKNYRVVQWYTKYYKQTDGKDIDSAHKLVNIVNELNKKRDVVVAIAKAVGLDQINVAVLETPSAESD